MFSWRLSVGVGRWHDGVDVNRGGDGDFGAGAVGRRVDGDITTGISQDKTVEIEAKAETFDAGVDGAFGARERLEELVDFGRVDAFAVIFDGDGNVFALELAGDIDLPTVVGVFDGIVNNRADDEGEERFVLDDWDALGGGLDDEILLADGWSFEGDGMFNHGLKVERGSIATGASANLREEEELIVDAAEAREAVVIEVIGFGGRFGGAGKVESADS